MLKKTLNCIAGKKLYDKTIYSKINTPISSALDTLEITKKLDLVLRTIDIKKLEKTFEK